MAQYRVYGADGISLAALADAGYTVDMLQAIPWSNMARDSAVPVSAVEAVTDLVLEPDSTWRSGHRPPFQRQSRRTSGVHSSPAMRSSSSVRL